MAKDIMTNNFSSQHIFIIGESRSGKTLLGNLISIHKDTCWFSNISDKFVYIRFLPMLHRIRDLPLVGEKIKKCIVNGNGPKFIPRPSEGGKIYHKYCKFEYSCWTTEKDLDHYYASSLQKIIENHQKFTKKRFFINDQSANLQRIRQMAKIFPNARFIHVIRDGRAVANEIIKTSWWNSNKIWWYGNCPEIWERSGRDPVVLGGLDWKNSIEVILNNKALFEKRYLEIRYEDLTKNTKKYLYQALKFCGLSWYCNYSKLIPEKIKNYNDRYKQELSQDQINKLNYEIGDLLTDLGYTY